MSEPYTVRWGILGCGWIASVFVGDLLLDPKTRDVTDVEHVIQACATSNSVERAKKFVEDVKAPASTTTYGSYEELVADPNVDIVYVATPHSHHFKHTLLALNAGKHVLCEKAFTVNAEQARILCRVAKEKGLFLMEAVWTRFFPISKQILKFVQDGTIGEVRRVVADLSFAQDPEERYGKDGDKHRMVNPDLAGGALLDLGIYSLTWVFQVLYHLQPAGSRVPPRTVGTISKYRTGVDAETTVVCQWENATGIATTSLRIDSDPTDTLAPSIRIMGTKGEIAVAHPAYMPNSYTILKKGEAPVKVDVKFPEGRGMHWQGDECARCLRDGKLESETIDHEESIVIMEAMDKVRFDNNFFFPDELESVKY